VVARQNIETGYTLVDYLPCEDAEKCVRKGHARGWKWHLSHRPFAYQGCYICETMGLANMRQS